ncbi:MAG TPA: hypothetical protein VNZ61_18695 [Roseomonas sp.]|nr:hypothetical protein [Roseomonas sp.]
MASETTDLPPAARRMAMAKALMALAQNDFLEEARLEAAARLLRATRRVLETAPAKLPLPAEIAGWDSRAVTAREHAEALRPAELDRLLVEGPRWAAALLRGESELRRAA